MIVRLQGRGRDVLTKVFFSRLIITVVVMHLPPSLMTAVPLILICFLQVQLQKHTRKRLERAGM